MQATQHASHDEGAADDALNQVAQVWHQGFGVPCLVA